MGDHVAFNLIGVVAASELERLPSDVATMVRVAEPHGHIAVNQKFREAVEAAGIDTLTFLPLERREG